MAKFIKKGGGAPMGGGAPGFGQPSKKKLLFNTGKVPVAAPFGTQPPDSGGQRSPGGPAYIQRDPSAAGAGQNDFEDAPTLLDIDVSQPSAAPGSAAPRGSVFELKCEKCGVVGELEEQMDEFDCPLCGGKMRPVAKAQPDIQPAGDSAEPLTDDEDSAPTIAISREQIDQYRNIKVAKPVDVGMFSSPATAVGIGTKTGSLFKKTETPQQNKTPSQPLPSRTSARPGEVAPSSQPVPTRTGLLSGITSNTGLIARGKPIESLLSSVRGENKSPEVDARRLEIERQKQELEKLRLEREEFERKNIEMENLRKEREDLDRQRKDEEARLRRGQEELDRQRRENAMREREDRLRKEEEDLERQRRELLRAQEQIEQWNRGKLEEEQKLQRVKAEADRLAREIEQGRKDEAVRKKNLEEMDRLVRESREKAAEEFGRLEKEKAELGSRRAKLEEEFKAKEKSLADSAKNLEDKISALEKEKDSLRKEISERGLDFDGKVKRLESEKDDIKKERDSETRKAKETEERLSKEAEALKKEIEELKKSAASHAEKLKTSGETGKTDTAAGDGKKPEDAKDDGKKTGDEKKPEDAKDDGKKPGDEKKPDDAKDDGKKPGDEKKPEDSKADNSQKTIPGKAKMPIGAKKTIPGFKPGQKFQPQPGKTDSSAPSGNGQKAGDTAAPHPDEVQALMAIIERDKKQRIRLILAFCVVIFVVAGVGGVYLLKGARGASAPAQPPPAKPAAAEPAPPAPAPSKPAPAPAAQSKPAASPAAPPPAAQDKPAASTAPETTEAAYAEVRQKLKPTYASKDEIDSALKVLRDFVKRFPNAPKDDIYIKNARQKIENLESMRSMY